MSRPLLLLLALLLFMGVCATSQSKLYFVTREIGMLEDSRPGMNSDRKLKLQAMACGVDVNRSFMLTSGTRVQVRSTSTFDTRETINDVKTATVSKDVKAVYQAGIVEVLDGPAKGKRGWVVLRKDVLGRYTDLFIEPEPETTNEELVK